MASVCGPGSAWIHIDLGRLDPDLDPGGQKRPSKRREATSVAWTSFMDAFSLIKNVINQCCVSDPVPGSGIRIFFFRIPDIGSEIHIFESLVTIYWVKSIMILGELPQIFVLYLFKNKIIFNLVMIFVATKKVGKQHIFFLLLFCCCRWIRDG
jgi:hypothetical protein